ncbi:MAG: DUF3108 domain-containing protein [Sedimenticolaceae bacterium]
MNLLVSLAVSVFLFTASVVQAADPVEKLQYLATYKGIFTLSETINICDVSLLNRTHEPKGYQETQMNVSSEKYGFVESMFPIRYRFTSWLEPSRKQTWVYEVFERTGDKDAKHHFVRLDQEGKDFKKADVKAAEQALLDTLSAGDFDPPDKTGYPIQYDRLGLLHALRGMSLQAGQEILLSVTNGKEPLRYRVRVEADKTLELNGQQWPALKLRFESFKLDDIDLKEATHRSIYIWLSNDADKIPLLAEMRHRFGLFRITYVGGSANHPITAKD